MLSVPSGDAMPPDLLVFRCSANYHLSSQVLGIPCCISQQLPEGSSVPQRKIFERSSSRSIITMCFAAEHRHTHWTCEQKATPMCTKLAWIRRRNCPSRFNLANFMVDRTKQSTPLKRLVRMPSMWRLACPCIKK